MVHFFSKEISNGISNSVFIKHRLVSLLKLCSSVKHLSELHARVHVFGLQQDSLLVAELVRFCAISPAKDLGYARAIVDHYSDDSATVSWNFLVRGYVSVDSPREALWAFREMRRRGIRPNNLTFPFLFKACAAIRGLREGLQVRVDTFKFGVDCDVYVGNTLICFYGSCKKISDARQLFDEMPVRTLVSWNSVITACVENSRFSDGIDYFAKMRDSDFEPDQTTMVLLLSASAELGNLGLGRRAHSQMTVKGMALNSKLGTALVDMYAKSGALVPAKSLFERLKERNVWTWSAMILGLAQHGSAEEALKLFSAMTSSSVPPNHVTYLGILSACSHAGLVHDAWRYFHDMQHVHKIAPTLSHYGAMVDVLARAGRVNEARRFITSMPVEADPAVWRTLLSACRGDRGIVGDEARMRLLELEPRQTGNLVMAANMYAGAGMWAEAAAVRKAMKRGRMRKPAGESCIELGGSVRRFLSGHCYDSQDDDTTIYQLVDVLNLHIMMLND